jgi:actin-related protein 6
VLNINRLCRFSVPELLFHPSDIGIQQMGLPELVMHVVSNCEAEVQPHLLRNVILTGGSTLFAGFQARLAKDLRALAPSEFKIQVTFPSDPTGYAWNGGKVIGKNTDLVKKLFVTKHDYEEHGHSICAEKFDI